MTTTPAQNDWEKRFDKKFVYQFAEPDNYSILLDAEDSLPTSSSQVKDFIRKELADARKEALDDMFFAICKLAEPDERQPSAGDLHTNIDSIHEIRERLAILGKETTPDPSGFVTEIVVTIEKPKI